MNANLQIKDNVSFLPYEESGAFFVIEGIINIYHSKIGHDGRPVGPRTFLFQMLEGELFIPLVPYTREDGITIGLLAVPTRDCTLKNTSPKLSPIMRPFVEEFVEKCGRRLGYFREQIEEACRALDEAGIEGFTFQYMRLLDEQLEAETNQVRSANRRRYAGEFGYLHGALGALRSVVSGSKAEENQFFVGMEYEPLVMACAAVAQASDIAITIPQAIKEGHFSGNAVESIAQASHYRTREVILSGGWHHQSGGNLLATIEKTGEPVALLQRSPRSYTLYNPATGEKVRITKKIAETINPRATMFYRSLPMHALTGKEVFRFVLRGTGKSDWIWVFVMGLCGGLLGILSPEITGKIFDTVIPAGDRSMLIQIGFLMGAMALTTFAFEITRAFATQRISGVAERDLQSAVWDRLLSLPVGFFKKYSAGELMERAMSISQIQQILTGTVANTVITSVFSVFYIIVMFTKSVRLTWIGIAIVLFTLIVSLGFGWLQLKHEAKQLEIDNKISGRMFGWLSGLAKIKMSGSEKRTFYNWAQMYRESRAITFRKETVGNWSKVWNSVVMLMTSIVLYAALFKLDGAQIATGSFIAFTAALGNLLQNCVQFSNALMTANVIGPLYNEAKPVFLATPEYDEQKTEAPTLTGDIELSRINFRYNKDGPWVLEDVSLRVRSGEHVALVGPSGSGKSTLFRILLAFEQPDSGEIYFDGMRLDQLDIRSVRQQLGVVLQAGQLLAGSIFENIAGSNPHITQADALRAIRQAGMEEDMKEMPMGIHTMVSEGAGTLSGGQRQRLMIARALAGNPRILFFDEATSALDNKTQKIVSDSINQLKTTRITIAHRLSTVQECDRIVVLEGGKITEEGTYQELMKRNGTFAAMARRQLA